MHYTSLVLSIIVGTYNIPINQLNAPNKLPSYIFTEFSICVNMYVCTLGSITPNFLESQFHSLNFNPFHFKNVLLLFYECI